MQSMRLGDKLRALRELEGSFRGLGGPMPKSMVVKLIREELGGKISPPYLSQLEAGTRAHMTARTRLLLARFFRVHPGYLVDDPEAFQSDLATPLPDAADSLAAWLRAGAARFEADRPVAEALARLAEHPERRRALQLLGDVLRAPGLLDRLLHVLQAPRG